MSPGRWRPDPLRQAAADYTLADLLVLPPDSHRVELVNGVLVLSPVCTVRHQEIASRLWIWLTAHASAGLRVSSAVSVALAHNHSRQPDVLLYRSDVPGDRVFLRPDEVALAVEIVSPGSRRIDRFTKPAEYAAAGIPCYWRVEQDPVHVYAYRLSDRLSPAGERQYELVTESAEVIDLTEPFEIKLPVAEITP